jgi:hypothetical protein
VRAAARYRALALAQSASQAAVESRAKDQASALAPATVVARRARSVEVEQVAMVAQVVQVAPA